MTTITKLSLSLLILFFASFGTASAQSESVSEMFKTHFNQTVQDVKSAENPKDQRLLLNASFDKMVRAVDRINEKAELTDDQRTELMAFKDQIVQKKNELNGADGFDEVQDDELIDFSDYSQQELEQANRTVTLSLTTALLIVLILLLL